MYFSLIEFGTPLYDASVDLRNELLRKPLNLEFTKDQISQEYQSFHLGVFSNDYDLLGVLILKPIDDSVLKMRQVAVRQDIQSNGLGTQLVQYSEKVAVEMGYKTIELSARKSTVQFYEKLKYESVGEEFEEVGIPHFKMTKKLI